MDKIWLKTLQSRVEVKNDKCGFTNKRNQDAPLPFEISNTESIFFKYNGIKNHMPK